MVRGDPPVEPSDLAGPRQVTYAPTPVRGHIPAPAARAAAEKALSCFNVDKTSDTELFKEIEERLLLAMSCSHLSLHDFTYLMISWGCDPALARTWLRDADYRGENFCVSACTWLLTAAYPLGPEEALSYQSSSRDIQKEKSLHRNWQKNRTRIAVDQRHATRRALLPPVDPGLALAWRKMALWRAQKLGWADVRHERGLLLGPLLDAAARITLLEFGLDPNKGEFNGALLRQLKSIDTKDWNDFMELRARVEMVSIGVLKEAPKDIAWLTPEEVASKLGRGRGISLNQAAEILSFHARNPSSDSDETMLFSRPGALEHATFMALAGNLIPALRSCTTEGEYEHQSD